MAKAFCVFVGLLLWSIQTAQDESLELIVWNVGQGSWATVIQNEVCWHFDMGGEKMDWPQLMSRCRKKINRVTISHWDMDHISFVGRARRALPQLCRMNLPVGPKSNAKARLIAKVPECALENPFPFWEDPKMTTTNGRSRVVLWQKILFPGDSSRVEEKIWIWKLRPITQTRILILGHHGSQSATSRVLLGQLPMVNMAIASSRFRRFGHPHRRVIEDLREFKIPLLRTEEWGHIHIEL